MESSLYKKNHPEDKRREDAQRIRSRHPDRVPIIVERYGNSSLGNLDKEKYLVSLDMTIEQFLFIIRKKLNEAGELRPETAIFLSAGSTILTGGLSFRDAYENYKDADGFLYLSYNTENTFG